MPPARLLSLTDVAVIAHRGGSKLRPENTLAAFDQAAALGVDGVECDVHLSRDGVPVVIHDPTLDRTTDATGTVSARSADELALVDAGYQFGSAEGHPFRGQGQGVPRLDQILERYRHLPVVVELKGDDPRVAERAFDVVRELGALDRVVFAGFSGAVLDVIRRRAPGVPTSASWEEAAAAIGGGPGWRPSAAPSYRLFQVPFRLQGEQKFDRAFVQAARAAQLPVQAWIIDEPDDIRQLIDWGVTGIISDRPDTAMELVRAKGRGQRAEGG